MSQPGRSFFFILLTIILHAGCSRETMTIDPVSGRKLIKIVLQTDWYAQAEHGGYYQAVAKGFYRDVGLDVSIAQAGPMVPIGQKLAIGSVQFCIGRSDEAIVAVARDIPFILVSAQMQHDPQALLLHRENPVNSFRDLDGKTIMSVPSANWLRYTEKTYHVKISVIPLNFGMGQFMSDPNFIQQCFVTNEPYYVEKNGGHPKTILLSDSGFDPYRILMGNADFVRRHPVETKAFVAASIRGWKDYLEGDPGPANRLIMSRNVQMTPEFVEYARNSMKKYRLVEGDPAKGERIGLLTRERLQQQIDILQELGTIDRKVTVEEVADMNFVESIPGRR